MALRQILVFAFFWSAFQLSAQDEDFQFIDFDYVSDIRSVQFHLAGNQTSPPILELNSNRRLVLKFDDMDAGRKRFIYKIVQCDADWTPSDLAYFDYIEGFDENNITEYNYSFKTLIPYTNYRFYLPNDDTQITKSGNYLVIVYEDEDDKIPVITRRFVVVEPWVEIFPQFVFPNDVSKNRSHQEIDFQVKYEGLNLKNPQRTVSASVVQNGRWDNAVVNLPVFSSISEPYLSFDYMNRIVFPAGMEWRNLDLRRLRLPSSDVKKISRFDDGYFVTLMKDRKRSSDHHLNYVDINGGYVISNGDFSIRNQVDSIATDTTNFGFNWFTNANIETRESLISDTDGDYANVLFSLDSHEYPDVDVYVFGAMSNWQLKDEFKMQYNNQYNAYVASVKLKQGFYNYAYVFASKDKKQVDFEEAEGNWFETENEYSIFVYYRPFGERYDRIIGVRVFNSRR